MDMIQNFNPDQFQKPNYSNSSYYSESSAVSYIFCETYLEAAESYTFVPVATLRIRSKMEINPLDIQLGRRDRSQEKMF